MTKFLGVLFCFAIFLFSNRIYAEESSSRNQEDPLKNTKKLVVSGHKSLYENGAFPVGSTSLKFIPPGREAEIFIQGRRFGFAKASFQESLKKASESIIVLKQGHGLSYRLAKETSAQSIQLSKNLRDAMVLPGYYVMSKAQADALGIGGKSWDRGLGYYNRTILEAEQMSSALFSSGKNLSNETKEMEARREKDKELQRKKREEEKEIQRKQLKQKIQEETGRFVLGYTNIGSRTLDRTGEALENMEEQKPIQDFSDWESIRKKFSDDMMDSIGDTWIGVKERISSGFQKAGSELENVESGAGLSWAILKAFAITTKTIFVDAIFYPIGETTVHSVGYVMMNAVAYPIGLVTISGKTVAVVLVEVVDYGSDGIIGIIAPTGRLALAGIIGGGQVLTDGVSGLTKESLTTTSEISTSVGKRAGVASLYGAGVVTSTTGKYLVAPVAMGVGATQESLMGIGSYTINTVSGAGMSATGSILSVTSLGAGHTAATAVYIGGSTVSAGTAGGFGVYYVSKAVGVPTGVYIGSGVVMSYEMTAQLSAHTILAGSDMTYLVLSLEGGKWVLYGVKQTGKNAKYILTGSVLDMDEVRKEGGEVYKIPVSDEEMEKVLKQVDQEAEPISK